VSPVSPVSPLTVTELETLAVMLASAGRRMSRARKPDGGYAWVDGYHDTLSDMGEFFYGLQDPARGTWVRIDA
jgi:hypothetical protein